MGPNKRRRDSTSINSETPEALHPKPSKNTQRPEVDHKVEYENTRNSYTQPKGANGQDPLTTLTAPHEGSAFEPKWISRPTWAALSVAT